MNSARALIAEDEPLLAAALAQALARAWPQLQVVTTVADGLSAVQQALALLPDVLFLDIRMPGQSGLDAAAELLDGWPESQDFPLLVFVTAYDQYAIEAFDAQAVDYLLKPVKKERLERCVQRLQTLLQTRAPAADAGHPADWQATAHQLRQLLAQLPPTASATPAPSAPPARPTAPLRFLNASLGNQVHLVPLQDVIYIEAADKYLRVLTAEREWLIRMPLKELIAQLDSAVFWQIHRGTVVRADAIERSERDEAGRLWLRLHGRPERLAVSRLWAHCFKPM